MKSIKWGIIGCGNVTEVKSGPAYKLTNGFELTAVMRRNREKLLDYAKRHNIEKCTTNADDLINDPAIDAIYIATPPDTHKYYALKVAEAGKPCCVEKPIAPCYEDSLAILNAFENKKLPLFVAYYRRSLPRFNQIKTWIENKEIGEIRHINWHFSRTPKPIDFSGEYNWRTDPKVAPGGYFDDLASHGLDLFIHLLGDIDEVKGISCNQQKLYEPKDAISACWLHKNRVTGSAFWNFGCNEYDDRVEILGSKGKIEFSVLKENPLLITKEGSRKELNIDNPANIQLYHVQNMSKHLIDKNFQHPSTGKTATHTSWVMDKILGKL